MLLLLVALEGIAGVRATWRMIRTRGGAPLRELPQATQHGNLTAIVPVLDEEHRLGACLAALSECGGSLNTILVIDGGSRDGTRAVAAAAATLDPRISFIDAPPTPAGWNGKAWNLEVGLRRATTRWIATIDADVRVGPALLDAAIARAESEGLAALSVATRQELPDPIAALLHPAFLTTLVYRAGLPNASTANPTRVQANGQLMLARRTTIVDADAFAHARASRCEDVTVARTIANTGERIGFYEGDATVRMHDSWRDCVANWPRSLTLRDHLVPSASFWLSLAELILAQALPLPTLLLLLASGDRRPFARVAIAITTALVATRIGVLIGTRRAYVRPPLTYWLSPLADLAAVALIVRSALRRTHVWRGRTLISGESA